MEILNSRPETHFLDHVLTITIHASSSTALCVEELQIIAVLAVPTEGSDYLVPPTFAKTS